MLMPQYKQLINVDSSLSKCTKASLLLQHDCFIYRAFQPLHLFLTELLKSDTDIVASYYQVVPYLKHCYASLAMSSAAHDD